MTPSIVNLLRDCLPSLISWGAMVLLRVLRSSFQPIHSSEHIMSNKLVFELFILLPDEDLLIGTSIRLIDVKSIRAADAIIKGKMFGQVGKQAFRVAIHLFVPNGEDGLIFYADEDFRRHPFGDRIVETLPFYIKKGVNGSSRWLVNPKLSAMVGKTFSQL